VGTTIADRRAEPEIGRTIGDERNVAGEMLAH
jgi:hypothetical protein